MANAKHKKLTIDDVKELGKVLIKVSNLYPLQFITERDFFPLVLTYLEGRIPGVDTEFNVTGGRVDFRFKGPNPTLLELAVQPREIQDVNFTTLVFPTNKSKSNLNASQNRSEIEKLTKDKKAKTRFLLLVDLRGNYDKANLIQRYKNESAKHPNGTSVRVVYVSRQEAYNFIC